MQPRPEWVPRWAAIVPLVAALCGPTAASATPASVHPTDARLHASAVWTPVLEVRSGGTWRPAHSVRLGVPSRFLLTAQGSVPHPATVRLLIRTTIEAPPAIDRPMRALSPSMFRLTVRFRSRLLVGYPLAVFQIDSGGNTTIVSLLFHVIGKPPPFPSP